jgi:hypothetical protein
LGEEYTTPDIKKADYQQSKTELFENHNLPSYIFRLIFQTY